MTLEGIVAHCLEVSQTTKGLNVIPQVEGDHLVALILRFEKRLFTTTGLLAVLRALPMMTHGMVVADSGGDISRGVINLNVNDQVKAAEPQFVIRAIDAVVDHLKGGPIGGQTAPSHGKGEGCHPDGCCEPSKGADAD